MDKKRAALFIFLMLCAVGFPSELVLAQSGPPTPSEQQSKAVDISQARYIRDADPSIRIQSEQVPGGRIDRALDIVRALYYVERDQPGQSSGGLGPNASARAYLSTRASRFGMDPALDDLAEVSTIATTYSQHVTYQQTVNGVPVYGRYIKVNMNRAGQVTMVLNGYAPHLKPFANTPQTPTLSSADSWSRAAAALDLHDVAHTDGTLMVYPSDPPRLVWRMVAWPRSPMVELEVIVDARTGDVVHSLPLSTHSHAPAEGKGAMHGASSSFGPTPPSVDALPEVLPHAVPAEPVTAVQRVTGSGLVYDPDPLTSSGSFYGAPFIDSEDVNNPQLDGELRRVDLLDIELGSDGLYRLRGPHVQIVGFTERGSVNYEPPAEGQPDAFNYTRENTFFEAVNAYFHVDKSQRYIKSLNIGRDIQNVSIELNPHGFPFEDNSRYFPESNLLVFGLGGVDDAEDAHVVWHEYGHAVLEGSAPGLLATPVDPEARAFHEGWADYWTASYLRSLVEEGAEGRQDWRSLFKWDSGDGQIWRGRVVDFVGTYPDDIFCDDGGFSCQVHADGLLWTTTMMEVYDFLGREETDRLNLTSHAYLVRSFTYMDAAVALVQADIDINDGANVPMLVDVLSRRGLVDPATFAPIGAHEPLTWIEDAGARVPVEVEAVGVASAIENVYLVYNRVNSTVLDTLELSLRSGNTYEGVFTVPDTEGEVTYFIAIEDAAGRTTFLPQIGDGSSYQFVIGPDNEAPTIAHIEIPELALIEWPTSVVANAEDNLGVDSMFVDYVVNDPRGGLFGEGTFALERTNGSFEAAFPASLYDVEPGTIVSYRLRAVDSSRAVNEAVLPESGFFTFNLVVREGFFRDYDFEQPIQGIAVSGEWDLGSPAYGARLARSGTAAWATNTAGPYQANSQQSSLQLPSMNLTEVEEAYLVFWHWYDTEHRGDATPESSDAVIWDGGNVKLSVDDGASWSVVEPVSGYNGRIASARDNPMEGEAAFGGDSYGWRRALIPIPVGAPVRLRFDFGTDAGVQGASLDHAGWFIDDVSIVTLLPEDEETPVLVTLPEELLVQRAGDLLPVVAASFEDDTGVASVIAEYTHENAGVTLGEGQFRLRMDSTSLTGFYGSFPVDPGSVEIGDVITYQFRVQDFDENEARYPDPMGGTPLRIEYRLQEALDVFADFNPTGQWAFEDEAWSLNQETQFEPLSSLVLGPLDLPSNVDEMQFAIAHTYRFATGNGGNLKISTDGGNVWRVVAPEGGYTGRLPDEEPTPVGMRDQEVFIGSQTGNSTAMFDLLSYAGQQVWLRVDYGASQDGGLTEAWTVLDASLSYSTLVLVDGGFDIPRSSTLHANYPDPFQTTTIISYTLDRGSPVEIDVYDTIGRRVALLVSEEQQAGTYSVTFDGTSLAPGLYLVRLQTNQEQLVETMVLVR